MSYGFIRDHVAVFPVAILCEVLGVSRSGYYDWARRPESRQAAADRVLAAEIRATHADSRGRYGSPRVHAALRAQGRRVGRKRVARLMRGMGLSARRGRRFRCTTDSRHAFPVAPNLLDRDFTAAAPDRVWLADLTYLWTAEGWLYLAVVLDLCTRRVVGWAMADHLVHDQLADPEQQHRQHRPHEAQGPAGDRKEGARVPDEPQKGPDVAKRRPAGAEARRRLGRGGGGGMGQGGNLLRGRTPT